MSEPIHLTSHFRLASFDLNLWILSLQLIWDDFYQNRKVNNAVLTHHVSSDFGTAVVCSLPSFSSTLISPSSLRLNFTQPHFLHCSHRLLRFRCLVAIILPVAAT